MNDRERPKPTTPGGAPPAAPPAGKPGTSGRVQFDDRGQAIWEWSVKTGMFDRNADARRIRKLLDAPSGLELVDYDAGAKPAPDAPAGAAPAKPAALPDRATGFDRYERVVREAPQPKRRESGGGDPYSSGPAKKPENVSFNPYERTPRR